VAVSGKFAYLATYGRQGLITTCDRLNLTMASDVHLMEPQWNPMVEAQALDRVHRLGQTRNVTATKYIIEDSFEEVLFSSILRIDQC
jgi:hypothetical protein